MSVDGFTDRELLIGAIRAYLRNNDELLNNKQFADMPHPLSGHCYVASEAFFHLTGGYDEWYVCRVEVATESPEGHYRPVTHWFLEDRESGEYVDLTEEQFEPYDVVIEARHEAGVRTGFMTEEPSERAQQVLTHVREEAKVL